MSSSIGRSTLLGTVGLALALLIGAIWLFSRDHKSQPGAGNEQIEGEGDGSAHDDSSTAARPVQTSAVLQDLERSQVVPIDTAENTLAIIPDDVLAISKEWIRRLDTARDQFELALNKENSDPTSLALSLVSVSIVSDLEQQGKYVAIPSGGKVSLAGKSVPEGERRMAFGGRMYFFRGSDYPVYDELQNAVSELGTQQAEGPPAKSLSPELLVAIDTCYMNARQRLERLPKDN